jgi:hypothetical protein
MHLSHRLFILATAIAATALAAPYSWQQPHATVLPNGDLEWAPLPYEYTPGHVVRYIDYEGGNDTNSGATKASPWRHHPWDPRASSFAESGAPGVDTYVFKCGSIYRGQIIVPERTSGTLADPVRLCSDPSWGEGAAALYGSERVTGRWRKVGTHPSIPQPAKVWAIQLDFVPRALWQVKGTNVTRIDLARTPNWEISDPQDVMSEWWEWQQPEWWKHMRVPDERSKLSNGAYGIDTINLTNTAAYYEDAVVRTEWGIVMGMPMPSRVERFDAEEHALAFSTPFLGPGFLITGQRYFLEDKPHYLDSPGEFWFDKRGHGGTLYVRLPGDTDPNNATLEAARHINLVDSKGMSHVTVCGLTFRFMNYLWNYEWYPFYSPDVRGACIRVLGGGDHITIANCVFEHVNKAVRIEAQAPADTLDRIVVRDNLIRDTDQAAIYIQDYTGGFRNSDPSEMSRLVRVELVRNRLHGISRRFARMEHGHAIQCQHPEDCIAAGNVLSRTWGGGMEIVPLKGNWQLRDAPFARLLVFHNKVTDSLLACNDWGAIRINQGGPGYIYNNVVRNVGGFANWRYRQGKKEGTPRFGHSYYLDGSYKKYLFNNIAWGANNEQGSKYANESAFQTLISFNNAVFNNTAYRFVQASRNQSPQLGRWRYLGNIYQDVSQYVFRHADPPKGKDPNAADAGKQGAEFDLATVAYADNVFYDITGSYGLFEPDGRSYTNLTAMRAAMQSDKLLCSQLGTNASASPLRDPANGDMRPTDATPPVAVKTFVPWPLYAVVGEWHFYENHAHPRKITDYHWYMQAPYPARQNYIDMPRYPLVAEWATADNFTSGPLEDWTMGALQFNGEPARVPHTALGQGAEYAPQDGPPVTVPGEQFKTVDMDTNSFLVEMYFKAPAGSPATLVSKLAEKRGYMLALDPDGKPVCALVAGSNRVKATGSTPVADGKWHHLIAEADRVELMLRIHVDGTLDTESTLELPADASLANLADFLVGGGDAGGFNGAIDFLRVSRGTLADARTTIEELYTWEFDGPFLKDFTGRPRQWGASAAGAIDFE